MTNFFTATGLDTTDISLRCIGGISPALVNSVYPMEALTKFHRAHHISGLTGCWMDTGATASGGAVKGSLHRLFHGHHLFEDGFKVVVNPDLKFGEFLHHLGMDSLTSRGIPNPLLPTAVGKQLVKLGMGPKFVNELLTINVPKILGGSVSLICAGRDVFLAFSDAIPHTFLAAGTHFGLGLLNIALGLYPPNIFLLTAGVAEIGVGIATTYRTIVDSSGPVPVYEEYIDKEDLNVFQHETVMPMPGIAKDPIGMLKGDRLLLNEAGVRQVSEVWAANGNFPKRDEQ